MDYDTTTLIFNDFYSQIKVTELHYLSAFLIIQNKPEMDEDVKFELGQDEVDEFNTDDNYGADNLEDQDNEGGEQDSGNHQANGNGGAEGDGDEESKPVVNNVANKG